MNVCFKSLRKKCLSELARSYGTISKEVQVALASNSPVVALESTIITHGMPYPANVQMAKDVEAICLNSKVTPATIALIEGEVCVGVSKAQLESLGTSTSNLHKVSRRDLPVIMAQKLSGGTTVSGTMIIAEKNGIDIFATGGIGGVHRNGENSLDVSADLTELGRTPVAVICAGVKSILDIGRTLEYLETQGVTVVTFGDNKEFPAFFTRQSGYYSSFNVESFKDAAEIIYENKKLDLGSGIVIAVPIPAEFEKDGKMIELAIQQSLKDAEEQGVAGSKVTPFILSNVNKLTKGSSLHANVGLVKNNVRVASGIAGALASIRGQARGYSTNTRTPPVIVGAVNIDVVAETFEARTESGIDLIKGSVYHAMGGVGRNIAECMLKQGQKSTLVSAVGDDILGQVFLSTHREMGVDNVVVVKDSQTPVANLFMENGDMVYGIGDFQLHHHITPDLITTELLHNAPLAILDCDPPVHTGLRLAELCQEMELPLFIEPTAPIKIRGMVQAGALQYTTIISPNLLELEYIMQALSLSVSPLLPSVNLSSIPSLFHPDIQQCLLHAKHCIAAMSRQFSRTVIVSIGPLGVLHYSVDQNDKGHVLHLSPAPSNQLPAKVVSASGAGDSLVGGYLAHLLGRDTGFRNIELDQIEPALKSGCFCAFQSLSTKDTISKSLSKEFVENGVREWEQGSEWTADVIYSDF